MPHKTYDIGVAKQIGPYADAVETAGGLRWLYTSGMPGLETSGDLPRDIEGQALLAWQHILGVLAQANMTINDIVKVTTSLINTNDLAAYAKIRSETLGDARPAFMLQIVSQLIRPDVLVEIEVIAAAA